MVRKQCKLSIDLLFALRYGSKYVQKFMEIYANRNMVRIENTSYKLIKILTHYYYTVSVNDRLST